MPLASRMSVRHYNRAQRCMFFLGQEGASCLPYNPADLFSWSLRPWFLGSQKGRGMVEATASTLVAEEWSYKHQYCDLGKVVLGYLSMIRTFSVDLNGLTSPKAAPGACPALQLV